MTRRKIIMKRKSKIHFEYLMRVSLFYSIKNNVPNKKVKWFAANICRSSHRMCSIKKLFLKILQIHNKKTCVGVSFLIKKLQHRCFPVNFMKFVRTPFLQNNSWQMLLYMIDILALNDLLLPTFIAAVPAYCRLMASPLFAHIKLWIRRQVDGNCSSGNKRPNFRSYK